MNRSRLILPLVAVSAAAAWILWPQDEPWAANPAESSTAPAVSQSDVSASVASSIPDQTRSQADATLDASITKQIVVRSESDPVSDATIHLVAWTDELPQLVAVDARARPPENTFTRLGVTGPSGTLDFQLAHPALVVVTHDDFAVGGHIVDPTSSDDVVVLLARGSSITGQVLTLGGEPLAHAPLSAMPSLYKRRLRDPAQVDAAGIAAMLFPARAESDTEGRFELTHVQGGPTRVTVEHPRFSPETRWVEAPSPDPLRILLHPGRARVHGTVTRASDGSAVPDVMISTTFRLPGDPHEADVGLAISRADGTFSLTTRADVPEGFLRTAHAEHAPAILRIPRLGIGSSYNVDISLDAGASLTGFVLDRDSGEPISDARVEVFHDDGVWITESRTDEKGSVTLSPVTANEAHTVLAYCPPAHRSGGIRGATSGSDFEVRLTRVASLTIRLIADETAFPDTFARLTMEGKMGNRLVDAQIDVDEATGTLTLPEVAAGDWRLVVVSPVHATSITRHVLVPGENELVVPLSRGTTLRGRVVDDDSGTPIANADVALADVTRLGVSVGGMEPRAKTSGDGTFVLDRLPDGSASIHVSAAGYAPLLAPAEGSTTEFRLQRAATLEVSVIGHDGERMTGIDALVRHDQSGEWKERNPSGSSVTMRGITPGRIHLTVSAHDLGNQFIQEAFDIAPGETVIREYTTAGGARVSGKVRLPAGLPDTAQPSVQTFRIATRDDARSHTLGTDRAYRFDGLLPGHRVIRVVTNSLEHPLEFQHDLILNEGDDLELDLEVPTSGFTGHVTDADGRPVVATLWLTSLAPGNWHDRLPWTTKCLGDGAYSLIGIPPGPIRVRVEADGFASYNAPHEVRDDRSATPLDIVLRKQAVATFWCRDATGLGLAGVIVDLDPASPRPLEKTRSATSDARGAATMSRLPTGDWKARARADGRFPAHAVFDTAEGSRRDVDMILRRTGNLELTVRQAGGAAIAGAVVFIHDGTASAEDWLAEGIITTSTGQLSTDAHGRLDVEGLPADKLTVAVDGTSMTVAIKPDDTTSRTLTLP